VASGSLEIMDMRGFFTSRGSQVIEAKDIGHRGDRETMEWISKKFLPKLIQHNEPFVLQFLNEETHPFPNFVFEKTEYIKELAAEGYPAAYLAFTWYDELLRRFIGDLEELGLKNNTELIIVPDHLLMRGHESLDGMERNLTLIFPWRKQDELWQRAQRKQLSLYDVAPTILDLLEVEYSPSFPWGANVFGSETGKTPTADDFSMIYGLTTGDLKGRTAQCEYRRGFCTGNEF
jgi:phosphoglycerol transferase MdoB-like AlkP superfamily enzyme